MQRGLVFVHIPKAAGTSLREVIARQYPRRVQLATEGPIVLSERQRQSVRVLVGHVDYDTYAQLAAPVDVITMLRDPVQRIISLYYYILRRPAHPFQELVQGCSLERFAASGWEQVRDHQVRQISGGPAPDLEAAKRNLMHGMRVFGIAERFDESLLLMQRALGWGHVLHRVLNMTADRPRGADIPRRAIAEIERANPADLELYAWASAEFTRRLARQDEAFGRSLRRLRRWNPLYSAIGAHLRAGVRCLPSPVVRGLRVARAAFDR
jgi:hypothetical protein